MHGVLNRRLYEAVRRNFTDVKVVRPGQNMEGYYDRQTVTDRFGMPAQRMTLVVTSWGEMYAANCRYCGDTTGRLAVSHRFGSYDYAVGDWLCHLWRCFNEDCQDEAANRRDLEHWLMIDPMRPRAGRPEERFHRDMLPAVTPVRKGDITPVEIPGHVVPLTELPADHPAVLYLAARGFDPTELVERWGVGYCTHVPPRRKGSYCQDRIVIPVVHKGILVAYQGRYVGDIDFKKLKIPKYLTYGPKAQVLYGLDRVGDSPYVVVMEGPTDVWRYGPGAVASLGQGLTDWQLALLAAAAAGRPVIWVADANAADDTEAPELAARDAGRLRNRHGYRGPVGRCPLAPGTDPGGTSRDELHVRVAFTANYCLRT